MNLTRTFFAFAFSIGTFMQTHASYDAEALRSYALHDSEFLRTTIIENHPGAVNQEDPDFLKNLEVAHTKAIGQIPSVTSLDEYRNLVKSYGQSFNDSHVRIWWEESATQDAHKATPQKDQFEIIDLDDGTILVRLPNFHPEPHEQEVIKHIAAQLPAYRTRKQIVFDVRGNHGGNTQWARIVLEGLFGKEYSDALIKKLCSNQYVDWRVSRGNLEYIKKTVLELSQEFGHEHPMTRAWADVARGIEQALSAGQDFYRSLDSEKNELEETASDLHLPENLVSGTIIAIVDKKCCSACLDFIDFLVAATPQAVLVGEETGADTCYMDVRTVALPSGLAQLTFPVKVYRNRTRGSNVPYPPDIRYEGDLSNTSQLIEWIKTQKLD